MGQIYDITPFSFLDYPDELACIVWISGCNLRCVYCHNPDIVFSRGKKDDAELFSFLETRKGRLTGVVFSGGEATFCANLPDLMRKTKEMGFKVKLDTNGSNPAILSALIGESLLDYVALDYKCPAWLAEKIVGSARFEEAFQESLRLLIDASDEGRIRLEVRTTAAPGILSEADINDMIAVLDNLNYKGTYWLQHIISSGDKTIGNIPKPPRALDKTKLAIPKNFTLGFRNFPPA